MVSVTANIFLLRRDPPPATSSPSSATAASSRPEPRPVAPVSPAVSTAVAASVAQALADNAGSQAFGDILAAAKIDPKLRRTLLEAFLRHRYEARFRSLNPYAQTERFTAEWWRNPDDRDYYSGPGSRERMREGRRIHEEFQAELAELEGRDPHELDLTDNPWLARQYSALPLDKARALHRLQTDYDDLEQQINVDASNFQLAADREKLRLLRSEREKDIAALLTPEELATWELRSSPTAERTRSLATEYAASEVEFHQIYALQKTFDTLFERNHDDPDSYKDYDWKEREKAQEALDAELRSLVGEERYARAKRQQDSDYTTAVAAADRLGLPPATADQIYSLRDPAATASQAIAADPKLDLAAKKAALATLAEHTRAQITLALGPEGAEAYFERGGMHWLKDLEQGEVVKLRPDGVDTSQLETSE
jgi:hypothetical protein